MIRSTLCYIEHNGKYLLLHRIKEKEDANAGKWIGVGGKIEEGETPEECLLREVKEETSLVLTAWRFCGEVHFSSDIYPYEVMYLYHATGFEGEVSPCSEGELAWVDKTEALSLPMWEGDKEFFPYIDAGEPPFFMLLEYKGEHLVGSSKKTLP